MKIIVTGACGFIGFAVANKLHSRGHEVIGIDRRASLQDSSFPLLKVDLLDLRTLTNVCGDLKPNIVVHLAARTSMKEVPPASERYAANTKGTDNLISAATASTDMRRIIFTSTKYVHRGDMQPQHRKYTPSTSYGHSKAEMEEIIWTRGHAIKEWCITRPTTVWGPGMGNHYQRFLRLLQQHRYFHIGHHKVLKHMAFIDNIAQQYCGLVEADRTDIHQQIFYMADYEPYTLRTWADGLAQEMGAAKPPTLPYSIAKLAALTGDCIVHAGIRKFPYNSFRFINLTQDDVVNVSNTRRVCGELPVGLHDAIRQTSLWFKALNGTR